MTQLRPHQQLTFDFFESRGWNLKFYEGDVEGELIGSLDRPDRWTADYLKQELNTVSSTTKNDALGQFLTGDSLVDRKRDDVDRTVEEETADDWLKLGASLELTDGEREICALMQIFPQSVEAMSPREVAFCDKYGISIKQMRIPIAGLSSLSCYVDKRTGIQRFIRLLRALSLYEPSFLVSAGKKPKSRPSRMQVELMWQLIAPEAYASCIAGAKSRSSREERITEFLESYVGAFIEIPDMISCHTQGTEDLPEFFFVRLDEYFRGRNRKFCITVFDEVPDGSALELKPWFAGGFYSDGIDVDYITKKIRAEFLSVGMILLEFDDGTLVPIHVSDQLREVEPGFSGETLQQVAVVGVASTLCLQSNVLDHESLSEKYGLSYSRDGRDWSHVDYVVPVVDDKEEDEKIPLDIVEKEQEVEPEDLSDNGDNDKSFITELDALHDRYGLDREGYEATNFRCSLIYGDPRFWAIDEPQNALLRSSLHTYEEMLRFNVASRPALVGACEVAEVLYSHLRLNSSFSKVMPPSKSSLYSRAFFFHLVAGASMFSVDATDQLISNLLESVLEDENLQFETVFQKWLSSAIIFNIAKRARPKHVRDKYAKLYVELSGEEKGQEDLNGLQEYYQVIRNFRPFVASKLLDCVFIRYHESSRLIDLDRLIQKSGVANSVDEYLSGHLFSTPPAFLWREFNQTYHLPLALAERAVFWRRVIGLKSGTKFFKQKLDSVIHG